MFIENAILLAYATTIISEIAIILAVQRPRKIWQWIIAIFLVNSLTHPLVVYFLRVQNAPYIPVEFGVFLTEMIWYKLAFNLNWKRSMIVSGTANMFSIFVGFGIRLLFGLQ
jgi:hypothetical protein